MQSPSSPGGRSQQLPLHPPPHQFHLPGAHFTERWGVGGGQGFSGACFLLDLLGFLLPLRVPAYFLNILGDVCLWSGLTTHPLL